MFGSRPAEHDTRAPCANRRKHRSDVTIAFAEQGLASEDRPPPDPAGLRARRVSSSQTTTPGSAAEFYAGERSSSARPKSAAGAADRALRG